MHLPLTARLFVVWCARRTSLLSNCSESAISTGIPNVDERITPSGLIGQTSCSPVAQCAKTIKHRPSGFPAARNAISSQSEDRSCDGETSSQDLVLGLAALQDGHSCRTPNNQISRPPRLPSSWSAARPWRLRTRTADPKLARLLFWRMVFLMTHAP